EVLPVTELAQRSEQYIRKAEVEQQKRHELQGKLAEAEQQMQHLNQQADLLNARKQTMLTQLQADTLEDAGFKIQAGNKRTQLEQTLAGEEQSITHLLKVAQLAEAETLLAQAVSTELKAQLLALRDEDD